uniref:WW domain-containing protein n=1 Tax=Palpitomonas bilix TaxID=652834 RepID=A0A7S3DC38_9EUKA
MEIQARVDEEDEEGVTSKVETGVVNDPSALELQKEKTEITQELLRMEKELVQKEMEDKLSKMANEKEALSHELKFMEELVSKADEERNKVVEEANAEKEVILKEIEYLEKQLLHSKTEVIEALKASSSTRDDIASELATLETEIEAFKGEKIKMEKANETLASMEREKLMLEHKLRDTELEIKETKDLTGSQMAALLRQKASIEKELERAKGEKESLAIQIKELQANMQEAQQEVKEALEIATADRNMLAKENEALEKELEGSKADRDRLAQQLRALKERIFGGDNGQVKSSLGAGFGMEAAVFGKEQLGFSEEECKKGEEVPDSVMWIAEKALVCQLPDGWSEGIGEEGKIVYRHRPVQGEAAVQAEHPLVALFKSATAKYRSEAAAEMGKGDEADMKKVRADAEAKLSADVEKEVGDLNAKRQGEEEAHRAEQKVKEEEEAKKKAKEEEEKFEKEVEKRVREEVQKKLDEKEKEEQARKEFNRTKIEQELEKKYKTDPIRAEREREMHDYAKYLGMDPVEDEHLLWIAEMALTAPLPIGWSEHLDDDGNIFFYDANTGSSTYEHPLDNAFRQYYAKMKEKEKPRGLAEQQDAKEMDNLRKKIDELQMEIARKDKLILQTKV